ncbi:GNAT family N-acetyltransferase [Actinoalloteichus hymeniacidonis]|uniref:GNAT family N-acetyltransferase n=1 Tax=Actinoalloteichus hymeniacidonis TaxID=340345 RepID=UPI00156104F6|nr:GNAT family N-acetyltransferase [Actinoalloteichus hymeniacidonis]MBB5909329.1 putative acetyltransferase [Actinoalloteichus hymeniacidonis]
MATQFSTADVTIRPVTRSELPRVFELNRLSFGRSRGGLAAGTDRPGLARWGAFGRRGELLASVADQRQSHYFGGRAVHAAGVTDLAVGPEYRGRGLGRRLLTRLLAEAHSRGAAISTLFPTLPALHRRLGWETTGSLTWYTLPAAALAGLRPAPDTRIREATTEDLPALARLYQRIAAQGNGLVERAGPGIGAVPRLPAGFVAVADGVESAAAVDTIGVAAAATDDAAASEGTIAADGITVVEGPDGDPEGYAVWTRGTGWGATARLTVHDLIATTRRAHLTLGAFLGGWAGGTPVLALRLEEPDSLRRLLPAGDLRVESEEPWMLRLVDVRAAVAARGWPPHLSCGLAMEIQDSVCPWNAGLRTLVLHEGSAILDTASSARIRIDIGGLAVLYAGGSRAATLRRCGLLTGGDAQDDAMIDAVFAGPRPTVLDRF